MLYVVIASAWCLLAYVALAICRVSAFSDDAHTIELAECFAASTRAARELTPADATAGRRFDGRGEARRATG